MPDIDKVIVEFPLEELHTGVRARASHFLEAYPNAKLCPVSPTKEGKVSILHRVKAVLTADVPSGYIVVIGLGSPPMFMFAQRARQLGRNVIFDVCDSSCEQLRLRLQTRSTKLIVAAVWLIVLQVLFGRLAVSYITEVDAIRDKSLNRRRRVSIVPMRVGSKFSSMPRPSGKADSIVLAGDFSSFHNEQGLNILLEAAALYEGPLRFNLYGPYKPAVPLPRNVTYKGFAKDPVEPLSGNCIAFISNMGGTGVPNKLWEAVAAGRPVMVHASVLLPEELAVRAFVWEDVASVLRGLMEIERLDFDE